jgi:hypothetical protein
MRARWTAGNVFSGKIVYFSGSEPESWYQVNMDWPDPVAFSTSNLYFSGAGGWIPNGDVIVDQAPVFANPYFADPANANYWMPDWSPAYSAIHFQPVATDQGPLPRQ